MPWIWVGRHCFDLADVALVSKAAGHSGSGDGILVTLRMGVTVDLDGADAADFLSAWQDHSAARPIERGPPRVLKPVHGRPCEMADPDEAANG